MFWRQVRVGMPRIPTAVLNAVFYLYASRDDAEHGRNPGATGFLVHYNGRGDSIGSRQAYAVTNWHAACRDGLSVIRVNKKDGGTDVLEFDPSEWHFLPGKYDVAAVPVTLDINVHEVAAVPTSIFANAPGDRPFHQKVGVGDDAFMVGLFLDHDGLVKNVPSARFGNISMLPNPKATIEQPTDYWGESFVVDIHSRTGFSGSPVFAYRTFGSDLSATNGGEYKFTDFKIDNLDDMLKRGTLRHPMSGAMRVSALFQLIGIHFAQFPEQWELKEKSKRPLANARKDLIVDGAYVEGMSGMTCVVPAWNIMEVLDMPSLKGPRDKQSAEHAERVRASMKPKAEAAPQSSGDNPTHREDFTRLLGAAVRKPELKD